MDALRNEGARTEEILAGATRIQDSPPARRGRCEFPKLSPRLLLLDFPHKIVQRLLNGALGLAGAKAKNVRPS